MLGLIDQMVLHKQKTTDTHCFRYATAASAVKSVVSAIYLLLMLATLVGKSAACAAVVIHFEADQSQNVHLLSNFQTFKPPL